MADDAIGRFKLVMGRVGVPGAPVLEFTGTADAEGRVIDGHGEIIQAVLGSPTKVVASGQFRYTGLAPRNDILLTLSGTCTSNERAPAEEKFAASATFDGRNLGSPVYEGTGSFGCGASELKDQPAKLEKL